MNISSPGFPGRGLRGARFQKKSGLAPPRRKTIRGTGGHNHAQAWARAAHKKKKKTKKRNGAKKKAGRSSLNKKTKSPEGTN